MPVKLFVRKEAEGTEPDEYLFDEEVVTIGRDGASRLTLPDPQRVVSKRHAEIRVGDHFAQLVDLGSKNCTYLNGERLEAERAYPLHDGDVFQVGNFEIRFEWGVPGDDQRSGFDDQTVFDIDLVNPFQEEVERLSEALIRIAEVYEREPASRRADALLRDAVDRVQGKVPTSSANLLLAELLSERTSAAGEATDPARWPTPSVREPPARRVETGDLGIRSGDPGRQAQVMEVLLRAISRLAGMPAEFRCEFLGQTMNYAPDAAFLFDQDPETLRAQLLDPSVPEDAARRRLDLLEEALGNLAVHQVALLEGYKASVREGARQLIEVLTPATVVSKLTEGSVRYRWVPALAKLEAVKRLQEECESLAVGDWSIAEQRVYRPAFIRAYLTRLSTAPPA